MRTSCCTESDGEPRCRSKSNLFQEFFEGKATEHLIAWGIRPEHLNEDKLGRVLDKLFAADLIKPFVNVAMKAVRRQEFL